MTKVGMIFEEERIRDIKAATKATAKATAEKMLRAGKFSAREIADYIPGMTVREVEKIQKEMLPKN